MKDKPVFPTDFTLVLDAGDPNETEAQALRRQHGNAQIERHREQERKSAMRLSQIEQAISQLPERSPRFPFPVRDLARAFEDTYSKLKRQPKAASSRDLQRELESIRTHSRKLADLLSKMTDETLDALTGANAGDSNGVFDFGLRASDFSYLSELASIKASCGGRPGQGVPRSLAETAKFVYEQWTGKRITASTNRGSFHEFLCTVLAIFGENANARHLISELQKTGQKNG